MGLIWADCIAGDWIPTKATSMFARKKREAARLASLMVPSASSSVIGKPMLISILGLVAIVTLGTNTHLFAPPLLALLFTAAVAAVLVSLRSQVSSDPDSGFHETRALCVSEDDSADAGVVGEALFVAAPMPMLVVDCEFQEIVAANPAASELYACPARELIGECMTNLLSTANEGMKSTSSDPVSGLARHRRADGSTLWVELNVRRMQFGGRTVWMIVVTDVTARIQLVQELEASERSCRELTELSLGIVFTHGLGGKLLMVNPAFARSLGHPVDALVGQTLSEFIVPRQHDAFAEYLLNICRHGRDSGAVHMLRQDGSELVWEFRNLLRTGADGSREVLCCAIDISERSRNERRAIESSRKDPLTGCYNRRHLAEFQADSQPGANWACVVIDIDHLKRYNDTHGHRAGDQAIVRVARFLERIVRKQDSVVRLGSDEFVILLSECDRASLESFAARLQGAQATHETIPFSFGMALRKKDEDLEQTIHRADRQMIERRVIERSSIRLDAPRDYRRTNEPPSPVVRIHAELESLGAPRMRAAAGDTEG